MVNSLMFGTKIGRLLKNSGKKERIQFWFASMVTVTATLLYTMFAFGLSDIGFKLIISSYMQVMCHKLSAKSHHYKLRLDAGWQF